MICTALIVGSMSITVGAANYDIGISGSDRGINGFSLSIGNYYSVPAQEIIMIERSVPNDETSVVYYLARHSHKSPQYVTNLRSHGMNWWDISVHLGLNPHTLYVVDSRRHSGPPYGKAYGYGRRHHLNDSEIVELVNVRFLSNYYGVSVDDIIDRRSRGQQYMHIDDDYRFEKHNKNRNRQEYKHEKRDYNQHKNNNKQGHGRGNKNRDD